LPRTLPQQAPTPCITSSKTDSLHDVARCFGHDLREQLSLISLHSQLLRHRCAAQLSEDALSLLEQMGAAVSRTERLSADLIAYLGMREASAGPAVRVCSELALKEALGELASVIESTGTVVTHGSLPDVQADPSHLKEIFTRLLDNAIKFHGQDSPRVAVNGTLVGHRAMFRVTDNGIGIDPRYAPQVFQPLKRLHGHAYAGTGMGLAFCRAILGQYGCPISVDSRPGQGATFAFELPAAREAA
jgi:light-regulated signal transduction histidine kinase (bacteriophytochrome)